MDDSEYSVLIFDANAASRRLAAQALQSLDVEVVAVEDVTSMISAAEERLPDVIVWGYVDADELGDVSRRVQEQLPAIVWTPVVLLAPRRDEVSDAFVANASVDEVCWKPLTREDVAGAVERTLLRLRRDMSAKLQLRRRLIELSEAAGQSADVLVEGARPLLPLLEEVVIRSGRVGHGGSWTQLIERIATGALPTGELSTECAVGPSGVDADLTATSEAASLMDLLQILSRHDTAGVLRIESARNAVDLYLENESICCIDFQRISNDLPDGRDLYANGQPVPFRELQERLACGKPRQRSVLAEFVDSGRLDPNSVPLLMVELGLEVLHDCLEEDGGYSLAFLSGERVPDGEVRTAGLSVQNFLLRLVSRSDEWGLFEDELDFGVEYSVAFDDADYSERGGSKMPLGDLERRVLEALSEPATIAELSRCCRLSTFDVCGVLYALSKRDLVVVHDAEPVLA